MLTLGVSSTVDKLPDLGDPGGGVGGRRGRCRGRPGAQHAGGEPSGADRDDALERLAGPHLARLVDGDRRRVVHKDTAVLGAERDNR